MNICHCLLVLVLFSCTQSENKSKEPFHDQADVYLQAYNTEYKKLSTDASEAAWVLNTKIEEGDTVTQKLYEEAAQKLADFTGSWQISIRRKISCHKRNPFADPKKADGIHPVWR